MKDRAILKEYASALNLAFYVADWFVITVTGLLAYWLYLGSPELDGRYTIVILIALLVAAWLFPRFSLYQTWRGVSVIDEVRQVTLGWGAVLLALTAVAFTTKMGAEYSRGWLMLWAAIGWFGLIIARIVLRAGLRELRRRGLNQRHIVIVGDVNLGAQVAERLQKAPWMGLNISAYFYGEGEQENIDGVPCLGGIDKVADYVFNKQIDQIWIAMPLRDEETVQWLLHELRHTTADIRYVPDFFGLRLLNHSVMDVAGLPVMNLSVSPMTGTNIFLKAIEDRLLSALILILISPVLLLIAFGVKISSPGPIFYRQERLGWNGQPFMMLKFRSMPVDVEKNGVQWGGAKDKSITKFGSFLRRTSLDELPQFINVLKGDMSIVGPRPERTMFVEKFKDEIPDYMKKHLVKAGITGWAQINGWRGDTDLNKRIEYDLYYIENWSLWFDIKIIFLTIFKGFISKHAR